MRKLKIRLFAIIILALGIFILGTTSVNASDDILSWADNSTLDGIGTGEAVTFSVAQRFDTNDLASYNGRKLTGVKFFSYADGATFTVKIWTGGSATDPGTLVYSNNVGVVNSSVSKTDMLTTPITINSTQELWIGYEVTTLGRTSCRSNY